MGNATGLIQFKTELPLRIFVFSIIPESPSFRQYFFEPALLS